MTVHIPDKTPGFIIAGSPHNRRRMKIPHVLFQQRAAMGLKLRFHTISPAEIHHRMRGQAVRNTESPEQRRAPALHSWVCLCAYCFSFQMSLFHLNRFSDLHSMSLTRLPNQSFCIHRAKCKPVCVCVFFCLSIFCSRKEDEQQQQRAGRTAL